MILNMGPQHPSTHGVLRVLLEIDGETIVRIMPDIGFLHTGIEKTCEAKFYQQVVPLTDRIDYLCPMTNNLCLLPGRGEAAGAGDSAESAVDAGADERADAHQFAPGMAGHARHGHRRMTVFLYCFREREDVLRLFEMVSGQRMMTSYFRIGGLALEPPLGFFDRVRTSPALSRQSRRIREPADNNPIFVMRTKGVAYLSAEDAIALGASGPTLRGSGVDIDLRRDMPYTATRISSSTCRCAAKATCLRGTCAACRSCASR
jgi:NADH-quinone oxidoreductase subunit D